MLSAMRNSWPIIFAVSLGASAAILGNVISFVMIAKINERSPATNRISYLWWGAGVRTRFKQLYPDKRLVLLVDCCVAIMVLCLVVVIKFWVFG